MKKDHTPQCGPLTDYHCMMIRCEPFFGPRCSSTGKVRGKKMHFSQLDSYSFRNHTRAGFDVSPSPHSAMALPRRASSVDNKSAKRLFAPVSTAAFRRGCVLVSPLCSYLQMLPHSQLALGPRSRLFSPHIVWAASSKLNSGVAHTQAARREH